MADFFKSLSAETTNATGKVHQVPDAGVYNIGAYGTWDGATVTFYVALDGDDSPSGTSYGFTDSNAAFTADGGYNVELAQGAKIWAATTNVGTSSLTAVISKTPIRGR